MGAGCSAILWIITLVGLLAGGFFVFNQVCNRGVSESEYLNEIAPAVKRYNSARDVVEETVRSVDSVVTLAEGVAVGRRGVADLESAIRDMNDAYKEIGNMEVPEKFRAHQTSTLAAWRSGTEAAVAVKLYIEGWLVSQEVDDSLVLEANRLFREEGMHQLEARRALEDAR